MKPNQLAAPIILVGAGRSGTKLLRGLLESHPDVRSFPREINYIWRHGNAGYPTDQLTPEHARPEVVRSIQRWFLGVAGRRPGVRVLEKTCANSLRVEFVRAVFPEAFVIHLIRDGRAVSESARRMWRAKPQLGYLMEKVRWVPVSDIPYYGWRYLRYQAARFRSRESVQGSWGPRFEGLDELSVKLPLLEVCGVQWSKCVEAAAASLGGMPQELCLTLRYEDLVREPLSMSRKLFEKVQLDFRPECEAYARDRIRSDFLSVWKERLLESEVEQLIPHIKDTMLRNGYLL